MALLLDTQIIIWMEEDANKIPDHIKSLIFQEPEVYFSQVSVWEMAVKIKIDKLSLNHQLEVFVDNFQRDYNIFPLNISFKQIYHTQQLPLHHRDPFDRLLISQSLIENMHLVSADDIFDKYEIKRLW